MTTVRSSRRMTSRHRPGVIAVLTATALLLMAGQALGRRHETESGPPTSTATIKRLFRRTHHGAKLLYVTRSPLILGPGWAGVVYRPKGSKGFDLIDLAVYHHTHLVGRPTVGQKGLLSPTGAWQTKLEGTGTFERVFSETFPEEFEEPSITTTYDAKGTFDWSFVSPGGEPFDLSSQYGGPISGHGTVTGTGTQTVTSQDPRRSGNCSFRFAGDPSNSLYEPLALPGPKGRREEIELEIQDSLETQPIGEYPETCPTPEMPELPDDAKLAFTVVVPQAPWTSPVGGPVSYRFHKARKFTEDGVAKSEETTLDLTGTGKLTLRGFDPNAE